MMYDFNMYVLPENTLTLYQEKGFESPEGLP